MNCIKKLPWSAGAYKADKRYYPQDRVFCEGSVFASLREQTGNKPEVSVEADGSYTVTEGWTLLSPGFSEPSMFDYNNLDNKPSIGGVELEGDRTLAELGLYSREEADERFVIRVRDCNDDFNNDFEN